MSVMTTPNFPPLLSTGASTGASATGVATQWPNPPIYRTEDDLLHDMLNSRMRWYQQQLAPAGHTIKYPTFTKVCTHRLSPETIAVFVAINGKAIVIEDNADLFPSDTLVTQLRLLEENK